MAVRQEHGILFCPYCICRKLLVALFRITWSPLGPGSSGDHCQDHSEKFVSEKVSEKHMMDRVTQICSKLELLHGANPYEMLGERSYPVIWEQFDPFGFNAASAITCQLAPGPFWLVKFLIAKGMKEALVNPPLKKILIPVPGQFSSSFYLSILGKCNKYIGCTYLLNLFGYFRWLTYTKRKK